jgi:energy-coupling factor transporter ATP-binding protein EcfA2
MMITDISIQNLRGIKQCEIHNLGQINLLIGKNSAGKSTILESIQLISSVMFYPPDQISVLVNRRSDRSWHPKELWYKYDDNLELSISLLFDNESRLRMTAHRESTVPENIGFYISGTTTESPIKVKEVTRDQTNRFQERIRNRAQIMLKPDKKQIGKLKLPDEVLSFFEGVTLIDPIGKMRTSMLEEEFQNIKFSAKYDDTIRALRQIYDEQMQSWELFPYFKRLGAENRTAFMYEGGRPVYVDNLGDGVKYGFAAITLAHNRHDSALLLEEIETHQHPSSLRMLIKFLIQIVRENRLQLFVSTQSPDALRYFKMLFPETKVFLIEKDPTKDIVYAHDDEDLIRLFREVGWDFEDLLQYERIAIVDGIEDEIIIENFFQKIRGYPLESEGVKLLLRGDQKKFGEIVRTFAISSRRIIVIKDLDEMKNYNDVVTLVVSWLKTLDNEGWNVQESEQQVIGEHRTSRKKWVIFKSNILKAGNPQRFPKYKKHSITDYLLEVILDHPELASKFAPKLDVSGYQLKADSSKEDLEFLCGKYNMDTVKSIVQATSKDMIPNSIKDDIIMVI